MPRSTYYKLRGKGEEPDSGDLIDDAVREEFERSSRRYGVRRMKRALERRGVVASRREDPRADEVAGAQEPPPEEGLRAERPRPNEAEAPNVLDRDLDGHAPHAHVCSDLAYVRVGAAWCHVCLPIDLHDREIVGHAASRGRDAALVMAAFATVAFPLHDIDVFHTDYAAESAKPQNRHIRSSQRDNAA